MSRVLWLPDYAAEEGLRVIEIPGWQTRGLDGLRPRCVVCHHIGITGGGNAPGLGVVTHGRAGLRNSLANGHLARNGTVSIVASGVCWHAGVGAFRGLSGNGRALGIEAEGTIGEPMPGVERDAYERLVAGWLRGIEREEHVAVDETWVCAHHHWRAEKPDAWALLHPAGEWDRFVAAVGRRLSGEGIPSDVAQEGLLMAISLNDDDGRRALVRWWFHQFLGRGPVSDYEMNLHVLALARDGADRCLTNIVDSDEGQRFARSRRASYLGAA